MAESPVAPLQDRMVNGRVGAPFSRDWDGGGAGQSVRQENTQRMPPAENLGEPNKANETVQRDGYPSLYGTGSVSILYQMATVADDIPAWGTNPWGRDQQLRDFWPTEPIFASALGTIVSKYTAFGWTLKGPQSLVPLYENMLNSVDGGKGWGPLMVKTLIDLKTQDNGAWWELVRWDNSDYTSPVVTINHLDSGRCIRTGRRDMPMRYKDTRGGIHDMKWWQCVDLTEFPSPIETARGLQYCSLTQMLRTAQLMKDISIYHREKLSGRFAGAIHFIGGIQNSVVQDALKRQSFDDDSRGLARYTQPIVIASLDPSTTVSKQSIEMASLPDGFNYDEFMRWYINQLALAFQGDYQDFSPLPGGSMGSGSSQANIMHLKSRGKGSAMFMQYIERIVNYHGIFPSMMKFSFGEQDTMANLEIAELEAKRAQERMSRVQAGEIDPETARMIAHDDGDLTDEQYEFIMSNPNRPMVPPQTTMGSDGATADSTGKTKDGTPVNGSDKVVKPSLTSAVVDDPPSGSLGAGSSDG